MKKLLVITACAVLGVTLLYFSPLNRASKKSESVEEISLEDAPPTAVTSATVLSAGSQTAPAPEQVLTGVTAQGGSSVLNLDDGTSVTIVDDGRGNRTESRFISSDRQIKGIIVNTSSDGRKQVRIMLADGSSRLMDSEPVPNVVRATPSRIATALGVFGDLTVRTTPTPIEEPSPVSSPTPLN